MSGIDDYILALTASLTARGSDMGLSDLIYSRNQPYAQPGPYTTYLDPSQELMFRQWLQAKTVPFNPDAQNQDYDMRGFWRAMQNREPRAVSSVNPYDQQMHYPDYWKTPYHQTFSSESQWARPGAPSWNQQGQLVDRQGRVIFDESR